MNSSIVRHGDAALADVTDVGQAEERVLVLAPTGRDAVLACAFLVRAGVRARTCVDMAALCRELQAPSGAVLISEEAFVGDALEQLAQALAHQPPWSDLPILVLGDARAEAGGHRSKILDTIGNATWIQRPAHTAALMSAVQTALRARRRQYQLRKHLAEREAREQAARMAARLEQTLRAQVSAARDDLERVLVSIRDELVIVDGSWRVRYVNDQATAQSGFQKEDMLGKSLWELFSDMVGGKFYHEAQRAMSEHRARQFDYYHPRRERWFEYRLYPQLQGLLILKNDITERKRAEERSCRLAAIVDSSADAVISQTPDGIITSWNGGAQRLYGYAAAEVIGRSIALIIPPEHAEKMEAAFGRVRSGRGVERIQTERVRQDGARVSVAVGISPIKNAEESVIGISTIESEMFSGNRTDHALHESEERYRRLIDFSPDALLVHVNEQIVYANPVALRFCGAADAAQILGRSPLDFVHPGDRELVKKCLEHIRATGEAATPLQHKWVRFDGSVLDIEAWMMPLPWNGDTAVHMVLHDITEHVRAENASREGEARERGHAAALQAIMAVVPAAIFISEDVGCRRITANRAGYELLRLPIGSNVSKSVAEGAPTHFRVFQGGRELQAHELPVQAAARGIEMRDFEEDIVFDDGTTVNLYGNAVPLYDEHGRPRGAVAAFVDISARRHTEQAWREAAARYRYIFEGAKVGIWELDYSRVKASVDELKAQGIADVRAYCKAHPEFMQRAAEQITIRDVNPEGVALWEAESREQLLGPVTPKVIPETTSLLEECLVALAEGRESFEAETTIVTARNNRRRVLCNFVFPSDRNQLCNTLVCTIDITERRHILESLQKSESALAQAQAIAHVGSWEWDIVDNAITWSDEMYRIFGLAPQSQRIVYPDFVDQLVAESDRSRLHDALRAVLEGGNPFEMELMVQLPDAGERIIQLSAGVTRDPQDRLTCIVGTAQDITQRKRVEEALRVSESRFHTALKSTPITMFQQDRQLVYAWVHNPLGGFSIPQVLGKRDEDLMAIAEEVAALTQFKQAVIARGTGARECFELHLQGEARQFDFICEPLRNSQDEVVGITGAAMDITRHVKLEAQLRRQAEQLTRMDQRKNEFMAMLAHELRNPLAPIHNAVHVLKIQPDPPDAKHVRWALDVIGRQVQHLARLVDDLLDVARITHGRIQLQPQSLDVGDALAQALETARPLFENRRHRLSYTPPAAPLRVHADPTRLAQIVGNLLNNAARYTPPGGNILLAARREHNRAVITVRDDGIGIAADTLPHVFDLFTQGPRTADDMQGGLGLGLALVHRLVERHGGRVTARSEGRGQGSEFTVYLPLSEGGAAVQTQAPQRATATRTGVRVLVVDDNKDVAQSFAILLGIMGHTVQTACDGASALEVVKSFRPDVAFVDIGLPDIDGYELGKRLRADFPVGTLRLIALTGYGQEEVRARAQAAGFDAHVLKPGDVETLEALLATLHG